jgi:hypothetical protein
LCKRFGVKDPNPDITTDTPMPGNSNSNTGGNAWKAEEAPAEADLRTATGSTGTDLTSSVGRRVERDLENVGLGEDESQGRDTLTYARPSMDIFKVIFASDDKYKFSQRLRALVTCNTPKTIRRGRAVRSRKKAKQRRKESSGKTRQYVLGHHSLR